MNVKTLILILFFSFFIFLLKAEENLTITAYYPSPYASYKILRLLPKEYNNVCTYNGTDYLCYNISLFYYNNTTKNIEFCDNSVVNPNQFWQKDGNNNIYLKNATIKVCITDNYVSRNMFSYGTLSVYRNTNNDTSPLFVVVDETGKEAINVTNVTYNATNATYRIIIGGPINDEQNFKNSTLYVNGSTYINTPVDTSSSDKYYSVYVTGKVYAKSLNTTTSSSDIRLKKNLENLTNVIDKLKDIQPVRFEWRKEEFPQKNLPSGKQIGLIAQEVEKYFPELVSADSQGYKNIDYQRFVAVLLAGIKEQIKEVERLEKLEKAREKKKMSFN